MRAKAAKKAKEAEGEEKTEAKVEGGWGEEPKWHVSGMQGGHTKREMWKMMLMPLDKGGKDPKTKTGPTVAKQVERIMTMIRAASVSEWEGRLLHYSDGPEGLWMTLGTREAVVAMVENGLYKLTDKLYSEEAWEMGGDSEVQIRNALMTGMREERRPTEGAAKGKERAEAKMAFAHAYARGQGRQRPQNKERGSPIFEYESYNIHIQK